MSSALSRSLQICFFLFAISTLISQSAVDLFSTLFAICFLVWLVKDHRSAKEFAKLPIWKWTLPWFVAVALSAGVNYETGAWHKLFDFRWIVLAAAIGIYLKHSHPSQKFLQCLAYVYFVACLYAVLVFFLQFNPVAPAYEMDRFANGTVRTGGFLIQPIVFGHLYALWLAVIMGIFLLKISQSTISRKNALRVGGLLTIGLLALLLSFTRGAWIGFFFAALAMSAFLKPRWFLAVLSSTFVVGFAMILVWPTMHDRVFEALAGDQERRNIWQCTWQMFLDHPWFGVGYGENPNLLADYYRRNGIESTFISHAHNEYLHILAGTGIIGFTAYLGFWGAILRWAIAIFKRIDRQQAVRAGIALGIIGVLVCYFFGGLTESNLEHSKIRYTLSLALGFLIWLS